MDEFLDLLACPACGHALAADWVCRGCGARFEVSEGIPNLRRPCDDRTEAVRRFYERAPFPGYPPRDNLLALHARAERSPFAGMLNQAIPGDARIVDVGCGTGQMCLYLARADRLVIGADLTRAALRLGADAARRFGLGRVQFVETNLRASGSESRGRSTWCTRPASCTTRPIRARRLRSWFGSRGPAGRSCSGVYNAFARIPLRVRRLVARLSGFRCIPFDPVLRDRRNEPARRDAWLRDQYQHPEEHRHTLARGAGLVRGERRGVPARLPERGAWR